MQLSAFIQSGVEDLKEIVKTLALLYMTLCQRV